MAAATSTKNSPSPTGDPQLNQLPQARQFFMWFVDHVSSRCLRWAYSMPLTFDILELLLWLIKAQIVCGAGIELSPRAGLDVSADLCAGIIVLR